MGGYSISSYRGLYGERNRSAFEGIKNDFAHLRNSLSFFDCFLVHPQYSYFYRGLGNFCRESCFDVVSLLFVYLLYIGVFFPLLLLLFTLQKSCKLVHLDFVLNMCYPIRQLASNFYSLFIKLAFSCYKSYMPGGNSDLMFLDSSL